MLKGYLVPMEPPGRLALKVALVRQAQLARRGSLVQLALLVLQGKTASQGRQGLLERSVRRGLLVPRVRLDNQ